MILFFAVILVFAIQVMYSILQGAFTHQHLSDPLTYSAANDGRGLNTPAKK